MNGVDWLPVDYIESGFSVRLTWTLLHFLWQGCLVALLVAMVASCLRRGSASWRYAVNVAGLLMMAACIPLTFSMIQVPHRRPLASSASSAVPGAASEHAGHFGPRDGPVSPSAPEGGLSEAVAAEPRAATIGHAAPFAAGPAADRSWVERYAPYLAGVYLAGVLVMLLRLLTALYGGWRLRLAATKIDAPPLLAMVSRQAKRMGLRVAPPIAWCRRVSVPVVVGVVKPAIVLPVSLASGLSPDQLESLLAHELAHLRRLDLLVMLLQRLIEAVLFFHPAVWYVSRKVSIERENACDDLVVAAGWQRARYADALVRVAEFCAAARGGSLAGQAALLSASGGSRSQFTRRVLRLLYGEPAVPLKLNRAGIAALTVGLLLLFLAPSMVQSFADFEAQAPSGERSNVSAETEEAGSGGWGEASGGLRMRVVPIAPTDDEERIDLDKRVRQFDHGDDLTLGIEIQNVSDGPVKLQGTRYGNNVTPPWPGKSVSSHFAPLLFDCEFFDKSGRPVERPQREIQAVDLSLMLHGGSVETLEPGKSLILLLRPTQWRGAYEHDLEPGEYRVRVTYHGPSEPARKRIGQTWKDNEIATAWSGRVRAGEASFRIAADPSRKPAELVWGDPVDGLRAAVEFLAAPPGQKKPVRPVPANVAVPYGSRLRVRLHVQNVGNDEVSFWSETWRQEDRVVIIDEAGKEREIGRVWYSGWANMVRHTLKPGQVAKLEAIALGVAADEESAKEFDHPIAPVVVDKPGKYRLRYTLRFGAVQRKDPDGKVVIPGEGDWTGTLTTGLTPLSVRQRQPEDEPPTFIGRLRFSSPQGELVGAGEVRVQVQSGGHEVFKGELSGGELSLPDCPLERLMVSMQARGFEEARFYDVEVEPDEVTTLTLTPAEPLRFRLVSRDDGKPVAGAKVRYFNRSKHDATAGPYPTAGLSGTVWATSDADGSAVLDTLQKVDPYETKLGNNIYYFYIEPPDLAPRFIGPVQAGQDLGEIQVGPILEVRGEVRGTEEELRNFAAEWDQPEPMKRGDGTVGWHYAKSEKLKTRRDGDKLTFQLTGLRPGTLRIVSNFRPGRKSNRHVYGRREPGPEDVVLEIDLTESRGDLVVRNRPSP